MKALSFLGTGKYEETNYDFQGQSSFTKYFPVAVCELFEPDELVVFTTELARERNFSGLADELNGHGDWHWRSVPVREGKSEEELWELFDTMAAQVDEGEELLLDITHGLRSLPLLMMIAAVYLRVAKRAHIRQIVYGAFEIGDRTAHRAPVFDLSPFLTLLDWTAATDQFRQTGNAERLAGLLRDRQNHLHRTGQGAADLPKRLKSAASALDDLSQAMRLVRVHETMELSAELTGRLAGVEEEATRWAKPFTVLLDQLQQGYAPFALKDAASDPEQDLRVQLQLIHWYIEKGWGLEAVALAREWLVSLVAHRRGGDVIADRTAAEHLLSSAVTLLPLGVQLPITAEAPVTQALVQTWDELSSLRNDLAHAGMRRQPSRAVTVQLKISKMYDRLAALIDNSGAGSASRTMRASKVRSGSRKRHTT